MASHWLGGGLTALFTAIAVAFVIYAGTMAVAIKAGAWQVVAPQPAPRR
jgi:hypothetical protein